MPTNLRVIFYFSILVAISFFIFVDSIPQPEKYYLFADHRNFSGINNFFNVISNIPFLLIGLFGVGLDFNNRLVCDKWSMAPVYTMLFAGVFLTGVGSMYFHLWPNGETLVWDRLPMTLVFMSLTTALLAEHLPPFATAKLFYPLLAVGLASVGYWHFTELAGRGDLRPYLLVQFLPLLVLPAVMLVRSSRFTRQGDIWWMLGCYGLAKGLELWDARIFQLTGVVSGHTLKHLVAATALWLLLRMLRLREKRDL